MRTMKRLLSRMAGVFKTQAYEQRLREEFAEHLALQTAENLQAGMTAQEARRQAMLKFGPVEAIKESYREQRGLPLLEAVSQDVRYALRTLRRDKGFALIAITVLAVGIGANTAIFSVLSALVLRPLPFYAADRLVWIENEFPDHKASGLSGVTSQVGVFWDWQRLSRSFEQLEAYNAFFGRGSYALAGAGEPQRLNGVEVTRNLFPMLGVKPQIGRLFLEEECQRNGPRAVLISHGLWERRFALDPGIVGRSVTLNELPSTIVGVMPREFDFGTVFAPGVRTDLFVPAILEDMQNWGNTLAVVGRLRPEMSVREAQAEMDVLMPRLLEAHSDWRGWTGARLQPLHQAVRGRMRNAILLLAGAVGVVLLIVCVNMGNLLLARAASRRQEMAVRASLGAGRGRLIRQMLTESLLLAGAGAALGIVLAVAATRGLASMQDMSLPLLHTVKVDGAALAFTAAVALFAGLMFGLAPAFAVSCTDLQEGLKESTRGASESRGKAWLRSGLVVSEIALACLLVVGAGLLVRSFLRVLDVDLGFRPERVAALRVDPSAKYSTREQRQAFITELLRRTREAPGIETASVTDALPLDRNRSWDIGAKGQVYPNGRPGAYVRMVHPGYFSTLTIPIRSGRDFTEHDNSGSARVIIVNDTGARALWPNQNAVGQVAMLGNSELQVVGVVSDVRHSGPEEAAGTEMYLPLLQMSSQSVDLVMRTSLEPNALASGIRAALRPVDPNLPVAEFRTLESLVDRAVSPRRLVVWLLGGFALIALTLASLGIYGVVAYSVNRRTQEIGIRMALGASAGNVRRSVLGETLGLAIAGVAVGLGAGFAVSGLVTSLLYGVAPRDPLTFLAAPLVLTVVALAAGYFPARRASRIHPMAALRAN